jgi:hypothetical protein
LQLAGKLVTSGSTWGCPDAQPTSCKSALRQTAQWRAAQRRLFNCNTERSRIAGPVRQRRAAQAQPFYLHCRIGYSRIAGPDSQPRAAQALPLLLHCRPVPHRRISNNGGQHSTASSPALQAGSHIAGPVPQGSSSCVAISCLSSLWRALAVSAAEPAAPHRGSGRGRPQDLAASSSCGITDAVTEGGPVETGIICT